MLIKLIVTLVIGGLCGTVASKIMKSQSTSLLRNISLGVVGGVVGGYLGSLIGIGGGWVTSILLAIGGSCLIVLVARKFAK